MQKVTLKPHELPYQINEEIKYLRANIQFCGDDKKVILFTSSVASEGKSTITLELAKSMAQMGKRVLLLDTDLRRSMLKHQVVNRETVKLGFSHYLSGMANLEDVLCVTDSPVIYVIFAGPVPPNPAELLASKRVSALLDWARNQFDYVLVDAAPLGTVIDAAALANQCDGAAVVVESGKISRRVVQGVLQQLKDAGCPVLGVILNKVDKPHGRSYYNYKYKYNYEYRKEDKK